MVSTGSLFGGLRTTVRDLFGFSDDALETGWIKVTGSVGFLSSYVATGNQTTPSFALVTGIDAGAASRYEVLSQVTEGAGLFTSLSLVNPGTIEFCALSGLMTNVMSSRETTGVFMFVVRLA